MNNFEFISKKRIFGKPLIHLSWDKNIVSDGVFSFGMRAKGFVSAGFLSTGMVCFGLLSFGVFSFGLLSLGLFAFALFSVGIFAVGGFAFGLIALGAFAVGLFAQGAFACGYFVACGYNAQAIIAVGKHISIGTYPYLYGNQALTDAVTKQFVPYEQVFEQIDELIPPSLIFFGDLIKQFLITFK